MQKPLGYDQAEGKQFSSSEKPPAGAYIMRIVQAQETKSQNGRPMLCLCLDIVDGPFANNFRKLYKFLQERNPDTKWPCVHRRCTDGNQLEYFKGDIKAIEESNAGFSFNWDEKTLYGKLVGCMLREKQIGINDDGSAKTVLEPGFLCSVGKVRSGALKPMKMKSIQDTGFVDSPSNAHGEDGLPF